MNCQTVYRESDPIDKNGHRQVVKDDPHIEHESFFLNGADRNSRL